MRVLGLILRKNEEDTSPPSFGEDGNGVFLRGRRALIGNNGLVAQPVARESHNLKVEGSSPSRTIFCPAFFPFTWWGYVDNLFILSFSPIHSLYDDDDYFNDDDVCVHSTISSASFMPKIASFSWTFCAL
jgi:hypothetical protein